MSEQETAGLPEETSEPQAQGLDAILSSAVEKHYEPEPAEASEASPDTSEPASARQRDERGRFAPKEPQSPVAEAAPEGPADATDAAENPEATKTPEQIAPAVEAPRNFTADQKAEFAKLPPEVQQTVLGIEKAREAEYTRRSQEVAELKRVAEPILQKVQPYQQYLGHIAQQVGATPADLIGQIIQAEYTLRMGSPEQKAQALAGIMNDYGIDLATLTGGQPGQQAHDPAFLHLRQQLDTVSRELNQIKSQAQAEQDRQVYSVIDQFAKATHADGSPKYPHFEVVKGAMAQLLVNNQSITMEDAYALAAKPIEDRIAAALKAKADEAEKHRQAALDKAKKAAPVRSSGSTPGGTTQGRGLDAIISDALARSGIG